MADLGRFDGDDIAGLMNRLKGRRGGLPRPSDAWAEEEAVRKAFTGSPLMREAGETFERSIEKIAQQRAGAPAPGVPSPHRAASPVAGQTQTSSQFIPHDRGGPSAAVAAIPLAGVAAGAGMIPMSDRIVDGIDWISSKTGDALFMGPMLLGLGAGALDLVGKGAGKLTGGNGNLLEKPANLLRKPGDLLQTKSVADIGGARALAFAQPVFNGVGAVAANIIPEGWQKRRFDYHSTLSTKHLNEARTAMQEIGQVSHAGLRQELNQMNRALQGGKGLQHVNLDRVFGHMERAGKLFETAGKDGAQAAAQLGKAQQALENATHHHGKALKWGNIKQHYRDTPQRWSKEKIGEAAWQTAFYAGAATQAYHTGKSFNTELHVLRDMYTDITGKDGSQLSAATLLFGGDLPAPIKNARWQVLREMGPSIGMQVANVVAIPKLFNFLTRRYGGAAAMFGGGAIAMGAGTVAQMIQGETNLLPMYKALKGAQKAGQQLDPQAYGELLSEFSDELKARGGLKSAFTRALAVEMAQKQEKVENIARMAADGSLGARIHTLQEEYMKHGGAPGAPQDAPAGSPPVRGSHVAAVTGKGAAPEREVVGRHTGLLQKQAVKAVQEQQLGINPVSPA